MYYILKDKEVLPCKDVFDWGTWFGESDRSIGRTWIGESHVCTSFLGIDSGYDNSKPLLFETMVFGGEHDGRQDRYSTYDEALKGHKDMCWEVMEFLEWEDENLGYRTFYMRNVQGIFIKDPI